MRKMTLNKPSLTVHLLSTSKIRSSHFSGYFIFPLSVPLGSSIQFHPSLHSYYGACYFRTFLATEHSSENLDFCLKVLKLRKLTDPEVVEKTASNIYST